MSRHASAEELASLDLDGLRPRKAARVRAHLGSCVQCTQLNSEMSAVPAMLAGVSYPPMSANMSARIDTALAAESAQRLATEPASEAHRRDLPERSGKRQGSWKLPGMSVLSTRLVAAAGALVIIGFGGYEIAAHAGSNVAGTSAASNGSATAPNVGQMSLGPSVQYGEPTSTKSVNTVTSSTNFTSADLGTQAAAAALAAKDRGYVGARATTAPAPTTNANSSKSDAARGSPADSQLASCLDAVAGNQTVVLVEQAKFQDQPATIIMTAQSATSSAQVWAVSPSCSASHPDVLDHVTLSHT
jgi:hypothetical protein